MSDSSCICGHRQSEHPYSRDCESVIVVDEEGYDEPCLCEEFKAGEFDPEFQRKASA